MDIVLYLEFKKARSAKFKTVLSTAKTVPGYAELDGLYTVSILDAHDFCMYQDELIYLMETIYSWKDAKVLLYGKPSKTAMAYHEFFQRLRQEAGKYAVILNNSSNVSLGAVTLERLPLPAVYYPELYGTFFGFAEDIGEQIYFCECERKAIENYFVVESSDNSEEDTTGFLFEDKAFPKTVLANAREKGLSSVKDTIQYREGLCFRCNKAIPKKKYCHPMYGDQFKQNYGWYVNQEYYHLGISHHSVWKNAFIPDVCPPELQEALQQIQRAENNKEITEQEKQTAIFACRQEIDRYVENSARVKLGFKRVGEAWVCETIMFQILEGIFGVKNVVRHYRPEWLDGLELDAYIPEKNVGFEYQGIQHFKAVEHWGGQSKLKIQQEHDARKKKICEDRGVCLICVNYDEPLTKEHILVRLKENGILQTT